MDSMYRSRIPASKNTGPSMDDMVLNRAYQSLVQDLQRGGGPVSATVASSSAGCSQQSLLATMMEKVTSLEAENAALKQRLAAATSSFSISPAAAGTQQDTPAVPSTPAAPQACSCGAAAAAAAASKEATELRQQCQQAQQLVSNIKAFLADYGLTWVGDASDSSDPAGGASSTLAAAATPGPAAPEKAPQPHSGGSGSSAGLPFDMSDLLACILELNQLVNAGETAIAPVSGPASKNSNSNSSSSSSSNWHQLQVAEAVTLMVFRDGLQLGDSPMRAYEDATANAILCDLFEGYFPAVLKKRYPDGVPLQLVDCSDKTMREAAAGAVKGGRNLVCFSELGQVQPVAHLQQGDFLSRLPASVIKDGRVVPIRGAVAEYLQGPSSTTAEGGQAGGITRRASGVQYTVLSRRSSKADTNEVTASCIQVPGPYREQPAAASAAEGSAEADTAGGSGQVATLQIKSEDGKQAFILKLRYTDTIGHVRRCIDKHREAQRQQQQPLGRYELRTAFPARVHTDDTVTLEEAQLVPNATLYMRSA